MDLTECPSVVLYAPAHDHRSEYNNAFARAEVAKDMTMSLCSLPLKGDRYRCREEASDEATCSVGVTSGRRELPWKAATYGRAVLTWTAQPVRSSVVPS